MDYFLVSRRRFNGSGTPIPERFFLTFEIYMTGAVGAAGKGRGVPYLCQFAGGVCEGDAGRF
jgi:hypothetical protein